MSREYPVRSKLVKSCSRCQWVEWWHTPKGRERHREWFARRKPTEGMREGKVSMVPCNRFIERGSFLEAVWETIHS